MFFQIDRENFTEWLFLTSSYDPEITMMIRFHNNPKTDNAVLIKFCFKNTVSKRVFPILNMVNLIRH